MLPSDAIPHSHQGKAYEMRVEHIAFNADGSACATVDRYYSAYGSSAPCALKFWSRNSGQTFSFSLNSRTDAAHKAPITAVAYHPRERACRLRAVCVPSECSHSVLTCAIQTWW